MRGGDKKWQWIKKGVPICLEVGLRDIANDSVCMSRRDQAPSVKQNITINAFVEQIDKFLDEIQTAIYERAKQYRDEHTHNINNLDDFNNFFTTKENDELIISGGFASCYAIDDPIIDEHLKPLKVTPRCIPIAQEGGEGKCIFTGKKVNKKIIFAKSY
jgi:prolyl-tRNA synthetase